MRAGGVSRAHANDTSCRTRAFGRKCCKEESNNLYLKFLIKQAFYIRYATENQPQKSETVIGGHLNASYSKIIVKYTLKKIKRGKFNVA